MGDVDDLTKEFLAESFEGLDRMDRCLTELESRPADKELLGEIFRSVHTIKGTTGFLGFARLEKLAHAGESLLGSLREGRLTAGAEVVSKLLQLMDGLRAILRLIELTGSEGSRPDDEDSELIAQIEALHRGRSELAAPVPVQSDASLPAASAAPASGQTLRIDVEVLNRVMNLVGELVLTRNQILQSSAAQGNSGVDGFPALARRLDAVTADLREAVMRARLQPVGHLFGKLPRLVRDLAVSCGKRVRIECEGQETGLDKSLLEAIKDPLTHALRNAIDHGIEAARVRQLAGKPAEGRLQLRAYHHNGSVVIEVEDDGAGIGKSRLLATALDRGLITPERAAAMSEREALQLIFLPGFSTAAKVTHISGRGVGMDVVRANVEKVGGTVEIESVEGRGTLLRLRVPLTLAIVQALVVRSGGQSFCLPQSALAELVYVPWSEAATKVEWIGGAELFPLRDRLLPMVRLDRLLGLDRLPANRQEHGFYLAVLEAGGCRYGLAVDDLLVPEEIVVKPLSPVLRAIGLFSGATVLGSGGLAMILDVAAVSQRAGVEPEPEAETCGPEAMPLASENLSFLVFEDGTANARPERRALPLSVVERIESIAVREVEYAGGRAVLQYRGELLALEDRGGALREPLANDRAAEVTVLICRRLADGRQAHRVGVVVRRVLEVAAGDLLDSELELGREPIARVNRRVTVVHDAFAAGLDSGLDSGLREVA
jgi:two-component system chemotaxis sensor kinase CheA